LKIINSFVTHVRILDPTKVNPDMRQLMGEQWPRVQELVAIDLLPLVGGGPRAVTLFGQRVGRRTKAKNVENQRLVIALILVRDKAALRSPTVTHGALFTQGPRPVNTAVESLGQSPDLLLLLGIVIEVDANRENACQQQRRVESGQLALP